MEDDNVAISLCLIIIASAALRLQRERRRPRRRVRPLICIFTCKWLYVRIFLDHFLFDPFQ